MIDKVLNSSKLLLTIFFLITFGFYQYNTLLEDFSDPDISLPVIYMIFVEKHEGFSLQLIQKGNQI